MFDSKHARKHRSRRVRKSFLSTAAIVERLEDRRLLTAYSFTNGSGGDWDTAANWNHGSGGFPGSVGTTDTATINNSSLEVPSLTVTHNQSNVHQIATLSLANNSTLNLGGGSIVTSALSFNNGGTLNVNGGTLGLNGTTIGGTGGALNDQSGGVIQATGSVLFNSPTFSMATGSELDVLANSTGAANVTPPAPFSNAGKIDLEQVGGTTNSATLTILPATTFINTGSIFTLGTGTISTLSNPLDNRGTLDPGGSTSAGTLNITGGLTLESSATVDINLGGTTSGTSSLVAATGAATLSGNLDLNVLGTYTPKVGDTITV